MRRMGIFCGMLKFHFFLFFFFFFLGGGGLCLICMMLGRGLQADAKTEPS